MKLDFETLNKTSFDKRAGRGGGEAQIFSQVPWMIGTLQKKKRYSMIGVPKSRLRSRVWYREEKKGNPSHFGHNLVS